ncbi:Hypothetical predicted protein [Mytilus galloprovincialis]|uniref:Uncharacterized protein n=1 Tax=Mytilus galloprovincialis TaxID=29158 RepID=A0A8B6CFL1_MYTGA|nr:Hypothetical predicted protein [Mytilus galloprovincialis]
MNNEHWVPNHCVPILPIDNIIIENNGCKGFKEKGREVINEEKSEDKSKNQQNSVQQSKLINFGENIDKDLSTVFDNIFPGASPEMKTFLTNQREALQAAGARRRRWKQKVIKVCLSLWSRSPRIVIFLFPSEADRNIFKIMETVETMKKPKDKKFELTNKEWKKQVGEIGKSAFGRNIFDPDMIFFVCISIVKPYLLW